MDLRLLPPACWNAGSEMRRLNATKNAGCPAGKIAWKVIEGAAKRPCRELRCAVFTLRLNCAFMESGRLLTRREMLRVSARGVLALGLAPKVLARERPAAF